MPAYFPDVAAAVALVVDALVAVNIETAVDTARVNVPGVWVRLSPSDPFPADLLSGESFVGVEVAAVVGAMPLTDAYSALVELADEVVGVLGHPDGPVRAQATIFGNDPVGLPTFVLPYHVAISKEGNPS